ncbi:unnamed protein product [Protopolystoma xenopodis]|uniref:Uncharacterized protein n=1 Tax=Protopolystoma xenopodis TaxID=117903 RepID=A0A448WUD0_9PLAT|nr:unnamed protein product [Protopolystoma xenopodis]
MSVFQGLLPNHFKKPLLDAGPLHSQGPNAALVVFGSPPAQILCSHAGSALASDGIRLETKRESFGSSPCPGQLTLIHRTEAKVTREGNQGRKCTHRVVWMEHARIGLIEVDFCVARLQGVRESHGRHTELHRHGSKFCVLAGLI